MNNFYSDDVPEGATVIDGSGYQWTSCTHSFGNIGAERVWKRNDIVANIEKDRDLTALWKLSHSSSNLNRFHRLNDQRQYEVFAPPHSTLGLVVCIQEEIGEIAEAVLGIEGEKQRKAHLTQEDLYKEIADAITYLSLLAGRYGIVDLEHMLYSRFDEVSDRANSNIKMTVST